MTSTITSQTKIQVGLAITLVAAAGGLYLQVYILSERVQEKFISKELFSAEIGSLRREFELNSRLFDQRLTELKQAVAAIQARDGR